MKEMIYPPNNEPIIKEMNGEQKLKILVSDCFSTTAPLTERTLYIVCLMAYYMGKAEVLEKQND